MVKDILTREQELFLEECSVEFADRFTDSDVEYKKTFDTGVPLPPIMHPWYGKSRFNNRDRPGGSRYDNNYRHRNRDSHQDNDYRDRGHYQNERGYGHREQDNHHNEGDHHHNERRFRPY